ncbi:hypothetical protein GCM10010123_32990 [Pilimelia anulata]|uniref:HTH cro/C1-type domain-containing protein n=1 Tax=Pilimelia anulata TaxID=53371 RepID=A0A8J3BAV7_9ACTN|nr:helix-turn-helix transcriptional regulator [Pilimelia anulata]GGK00479.1 hypothetical protein GCM10010123_32990 [Pilimelia anulata]
MPNSIVNPRFSATLRRLRAERGLSVRDLSRLVHHGKTLVHDLETGRARPGYDIARRLDDALRAGGELAAMAVAGSGLPDPDEAARVAHVVRHPRRVDLSTVASLATVLAHQRRLEDTIGSAAMLGPVVGQLCVIEHLVTETSGHLRSDLVDVASQWAQFAGWLAVATGRPAGAAARFDRALALAAEIGGREMTATALSFKGYLAERMGQPGAMVGLTEAAMRDRGVFIGQRAYDALQLARGHAMRDDRAGVGSALAEAADLTAGFAEYGGPVPDWHYYRSPAFFDIEQGRVYALLGEHEPDGNRRAVDLLAAGLDALPAEQRGAEWAAEYRLHLAHALARAGNPTAARAAAEAVRVVASASGAAALVRRAEELSARLSGDT